MKLKSSTPVLRSFDEAKAREFYVWFLGFQVDWQHRFGDNFPLYMQVTRDACVLHLSEHHGDACPGAALRIELAGVDEFCAELQAKDYQNFKPGPPTATSPAAEGPGPRRRPPGPARGSAARAPPR